MLALSLLVSGVVLAVSSAGKSPVSKDEQTDTETTVIPTDPVIDYSDPDCPFTKPVYTEPTSEELLQELKDDLTETPENKAILKAEYEALVSERDAITAKENSSGLTQAEELRKREVEGWMSILRLQDIYPDIRQVLEANFINTYEQIRLDEEYTLNHREVDEFEKNHAKAFLNLAIELETRFKSGVDVETLYLYFFEQVYAISALN